MKNFYILLFVLVSLNGTGQTWNIQSSGTNQNLMSIGFADPLVGVAVGNNGTILWTDNGGQVWHSSSLKDNTNYLSTSMKITNGQREAWICGDNGTIKYAPFYTGANPVWIAQNSGMSFGLNDLEMSPQTNNRTGYAVGDAATVIKTTDGGQTWTRITNFPFLVFLTSVSVDPNDPNKIIVAGDQGVIVSSDDGGTTWNIIQASGSQYWGACVYTGAYTGWISGSPASLTHFSGDTLTDYNLGSMTAGLMGLAFGTANYGTAVGDSGKILHYDGTSWTPETSPTTEWLTSASAAVDYSTKDYFTIIYTWAAGLNGMILGKTQIISGIESQDLQEVSLQPNPARDFFTVKGFGKQAEYKVRITDLQGRRLKEFSSAGSNEFNISNLAEGVYLVTIYNGRSNLTRKLVVSF